MLFLTAVVYYSITKGADMKNQKVGNDKKGFTFLEMMIVVVIIGILAAIAIPNFIDMQVESKEAIVKQNCHTMQLAVEDFAIQNNGVCPVDIVYDINLCGNTLKDLLPGGEWLENPFTGQKTEPQLGFGGQEGQITYQPFWTNGVTRYVIEGYGKDGRSVIALTRD